MNVKYRPSFVIVSHFNRLVNFFVSRLDYELKYVEGQLERLEKTNALNATFHIWHSGHFGTINTFRLGKLPTEPVDWNEINAAWGQTALLLNSLARRISFKFYTYQIVPFGNHSYIKVTH